MRSATLFVRTFCFIGMLAMVCRSWTQVSVLTERNDNQRSGTNIAEIQLNTGNVQPGTFGLLFRRTVDGQIYSQPLYVPSVTIPGKGVHNLILVTTEHDSVYAFDADDPAASNALWHTSFIDPAHGVTTCPYQDISTAKDIHPEIGITSTPAILVNPQSGRGLVFVTAKTKEKTPNGFSYVWRLHKLDLHTGSEVAGSPKVIAATVRGTGAGSVNGLVSFVPMVQNQRPGLLIDQGVLYLAFGSHGDVGPYHGWVLAYNTNTLDQIAAWCSTPNGAGGGIWQAGYGLVADLQGNLLFETGNGLYDEATTDFGDCFVKLSNATFGLGPIDSFTPAEQLAEDQFDLDLGCSGPLYLPNFDLTIGGGKNGRVFALDSNRLGGYDPAAEKGAVQIVMSGNNNLFSTPIALWDGERGSVFVSAQGDHIRSYTLMSSPTQPLSSRPAWQSAISPASGAALAISTDAYAPGTSVLWGNMGAGSRGQADVIPGVLRAWDAANLEELWNSDMTPADSLGNLAKFVTPTVAAGKVYLPSFPTDDGSVPGSLACYGLKGAATNLPFPPGGLTLVPGNGTVQLNWTPAKGAISYNIYRSSVLSGAMKLCMKDVVGLSAQDRSLSNGVAYHYAVCAVNRAGQSAISPVVTVTPTVAALVYAIHCGGGVVPGFGADANFQGGTTLQNSRPADQDTVYASARVGSFLYTLGGLTPNQTYPVTLNFVDLEYSSPGERQMDVLVNGVAAIAGLDLVGSAGSGVGFSRSIGAKANSSGSVILEFQPSAGSIGRTATVSGIGLGSSKPLVPLQLGGFQAISEVGYVKLAWRDNPTATTYNIYRGTDPGKETLYLTGLHSPSYTDWEGVLGTRYYYRETACNRAGESVSSSEQSATAGDFSISCSVSKVTLSRGASTNFTLTLNTPGIPDTMAKMPSWPETNFGQIDLGAGSAGFNKPLNVGVTISPRAHLGASSVTFTATIGPVLRSFTVAVMVSG